jgi:hypothetical protein
MPIIIETAGVRYFPEPLPCIEGGPTMKKSRSVIQPHGLDEVAADKTACSKQLLEVTRRNLHFRGDIAGTEMWIREPFLDDAADPCEQSIRMGRYGSLPRRSKHCAEQIKDGQFHIGIVAIRDRTLAVDPIQEVDEHTLSASLSAGHAARRLNSEVLNDSLAR